MPGKHTDNERKVAKDRYQYLNRRIIEENRFWIEQNYDKYCLDALNYAKKIENDLVELWKKEFKINLETHRKNIGDATEAYKDPDELANISAHMDIEFVKNNPTFFLNLNDDAKQQQLEINNSELTPVQKEQAIQVIKFLKEKPELAKTAEKFAAMTYANESLSSKKNNTDEKGKALIQFATRVETNQKSLQEVRLDSKWRYFLNKVRKFISVFINHYESKGAEIVARVSKNKNKLSLFSSTNATPPNSPKNDSGSTIKLDKRN